MDKLRYKDQENFKATSKGKCSYLKRIIDNPFLRLRALLLGIYGLVLASDVFVQTIFKWKTYDDCHVQWTPHGAMGLLEEYGNSIVMVDIALGFGNACLLCVTSVMLILSALMRSYSFRYFAVPAILVVAVEMTNDLTEGILFLSYMAGYLEPMQMLSSTGLHLLWLAAEVFFWVGAVRFFERLPPLNGNCAKAVLETGRRCAVPSLELQISYTSFKFDIEKPLCTRVTSTQAL